jgi:hypothetical protein
LVIHVLLVELRRRGAASKLRNVTDVASVAVACRATVHGFGHPPAR